jgi:hypothetical protein
VTLQIVAPPEVKIEKLRPEDWLKPEATRAHS